MIPEDVKEEIISKIDLISYMQSRGIDIVGNENIRCPLPGHTDDIPSFSVHPEGQYFNCFSGGCGRGGDILTFIMEFDQIGFKEAIKKAADYAGYDLEGVIDKEDAREFEEQKMLKEIYKDAAEHMHSRLPDDMREHLRNNYGFTDEFIDYKKIGFDDGTLLMALEEKGWTKEEILKTGLFLYKEDSNWTKGAFEKRIVFWYWKRGFPTYAIARKCKHTPDNKYEDPKYKKLLVARKDRQYISKHVKNKCIYNEDICLNSANRPPYVVITEGITDAMLAEQMGIPVISPVTVRFRKDDFPKLEKLTKFIDNIYIVNDNEDGDAGLDGALDTAEFLNSAGKQVHITLLPRDTREKVDLNLFLQDVTKREFEDYIQKSKTYIQFLVEEALEFKEQGNQMKMQNKIDKALLQTKNMKPMMRDNIFSLISDKLSIGKTVIKKQFKEIKKEEKKKPEYREKDDYYEEILEDAKQDSKADQLWKALIDDGASFYKMNREEVSMIYNGEFYKIQDGDCPFTHLLVNKFGINAMQRKNRAMLFEFKAKALQHATKIKKQTWLYCDKYEEEVYFAVGYDNPYIYKIDNQSIDKVYNGNHKGIFVERPDEVLEPWDYNPDIDQKEVALEMYELFSKYVPCKEEDSIMFLISCMCVPLKRYNDTDPLIKFHGESSAGKSQAAKLLSSIWYQEADSTVGSMTTASMYDKGSKRPFIFLDNFEHLTEDDILFLIYSSSNAAREKRVSGSDTGTISQKVDSMVIVTAIDPFNRTPLLNRSLDFIAKKKYHCHEEAISIVNDKAMENRDKYLSLWIQLVQKCLSNRAGFRENTNIINSAVGSHFKERLNSFFGIAWEMAKNFLGLCGWSEDDIDDLFFKWIDYQATFGSDSEKSSNVIFNYLNRLASKIRSGNHLDFIFEDLEDDHPSRIEFLVSTSQLLNIFKQIARELGERFPYTSPQQLMARMKNALDLLVESDNGWQFKKNAKMKNGIWHHRFIHDIKAGDHDWMNQ